MTECAECRKHWWTVQGKPADGPAFTPYFEQCDVMGLSGVDRIAWLRQQPAPPGLLTRAKRFNYWRIPEVNPLWATRGIDSSAAETIAMEGHRHLSQVYEARHAAGDEDAIFEYMRRDVNAFQSPWVQTQVLAWRLENSGPSIALLKELMAAFTDNASRGDRAKHLGKLAAIIGRDQRIFRLLWERHEFAGDKLSGLIGDDKAPAGSTRRVDIAGESVSVHTAHEIWFEYSSEMGSLKDCAGSQDAVFDLLDVLRQRLTSAAGIELPT
jgi:hypothetical protein